MSDVDQSSQYVSRRGLLLGGIIVAAAVGGGAWYRRQAPHYGGASLTVSQAHEDAMDGKITLIDIRTPKEWKATGVAEGAHMIDMRRDDFVTALQEVAGESPDAPIALICARGVRSARMSLKLTEAGFTNIIDVPEGMLGSADGPGWVKTGLPLNEWNGEKG